MFFISPPFGNYLSLPGTKSISGSYTLEARPGLFMQIFKSFRYSFEYGGWINKIGLRNPGLDYAVNSYKKAIKEKRDPGIRSIAILKKEEIPIILSKIPDTMDIELNVSCPNLSKSDPSQTLVKSDLGKFINPKREWCIMKLPAKMKMTDVDEYYKAGFRQFHCSNTLPIEERGGLSGPTLIPYSLSNISAIRAKYPDVTIIGGGGIRNVETSKLYKVMGSDYISVSTLCLNPILFAKFYYDMK